MIGKYLITTPNNIQFIKFTHSNNMFSKKKSITKKTTTYEPLISNLITNICNVTPLVVIVASVGATLHMPSMKCLELQLKSRLQIKDIQIN